MINDILKKINKGHEVESSKVELAAHDIHLAKSLQELNALYAELQKAGEGISKYGSMVRQAIQGFRNAAKTQSILAERYKSEMKGTADLAKSLGLEIPNSTLNNMKFIDMFITRAKAMSNVSDQMEGGLKKITGA
jgi:hypothetical protein